MRLRLLCRIRAESVEEASGLVVSRRNPGVAWVCNDSGNDPELVAIDLRDGRRRATLRCDGARNEDWEALALDPKGRLVVADTGDNASARREVSLYRVPEPLLPAGKSDLRARPERLVRTYPDFPRDAETLLCDPVDGALWIVTKDPGGHSAVYRVDERERRLKRASVGVTLATPMPRGRGGLQRALGSLRVTDGAVSPDGRWVALLTYGRIVRYALRAPGRPGVPTRSLADAFASQPLETPLPDALEQAEAIAYGPDGRLYVTGEGEHPPLYISEG